MKKTFSILFALVLVLSFSVMTATPLAAATINVPTDQPTIQAAVAAASSGDTINVADGTYTITSAITVDKGVTITGNINNPENVVVTYSAPSTTLDCFDMQANDITVQGISAVNGRYGFNFAASDPTGCTISDCVIDHCYEGAINIDGGSGHTISDNTITHCLTSGTKRGVIHIYGCPDTTIDGNTLTDNGLTGYHATMGIYVKFTYPSSSSERVEVINNNISGMLGINADIQVYDAPYTYIYNNTISNSEDKGIAVFGIYGSPAYTSTSNRVEVIGNTISSTYYPGVQAANAPYTYFYNNTLTHCNYYGGDGSGDFDYASIHIDSGSAHCLIDSNTVTDGINGIQTWSNDVTITRNDISDMGLTYADTKVVGARTYKNSAIVIGSNWGSGDLDPTGTVIQCNTIHDNYWGLFYSADLTNGVTAENNWWGDASGPSGAGPGSGDAVSANVDYTPWGTASSIATATGTGTASFATACGSISALTSIPEGSLPTAGKPNLAFPHGFFSFDITGLTSGQTVTVIITLPSGVRRGTQYWKYHASEGGWIQIPMGDDDADNVITITLVDGGLGDDDGVANGVIVDQGGPGSPGGDVGWETYPLNKLAAAAPWIALFAAIIAGASLLVLRRRRAQT